MHKKNLYGITQNKKIKIYVVCYEYKNDGLKDVNIDFKPSVLLRKKVV